VNELFDYIQHKYEKVIPSKKEGLLLFCLHQKILNKEIAKEFTYKDIERSLKEIAEKEIDPTIPQTQRVLENLMTYYIERPPGGGYNKYVLTDFAQNLLVLIENKIVNPYRQLPLKQSFEKYAQFDATNISNIDDFEEWFLNGFSNTTKQNIINHLEGLKDELTQSIEQLKAILHSSEGNIVEIVANFTDVFKRLGVRANEIGETLYLKNKLKGEIEKTISYFYQKIEDTKAPTSKLEIEAYEIIEKEYERAKEIEKTVEDFFTKVEYRLKQLTERILFADQRLNDLKDNFQYRSQFNINTTKLLRLALTESSYSKEGVVLPTHFPRYNYIQENTRYVKIPYLEFDLHFNNEIIPIQINNNEQDKQRKEIDRELMKKERIATLSSHYKELLITQKELDFTQQFHKILQEEDDIEIAIQVGYEIIQHANKTTEYEINTEKLLYEMEVEKDIWTWKTKIYQKA
jgi:hypothetical protein